MAATVLAEAGKCVRLFDAMPSPGCKFLVAGRGGLNLTHSEPIPDFISRYGAWSPLFERFIQKFSPDDLRTFCNRLGIETSIGSSRRVFPSKVSAGTFLDLWMRHLTDLNVVFCPRHRWLCFTQAGAVHFSSLGEYHKDVAQISCAAVLLALGGASWPKTGSDGHWAERLKEHGIQVNAFKPANCGFTVAWSSRFVERHQGSPLKNIAINFAAKRVMGELLITAYGLEGGGIYTLGPLLREAIERDARACLSIDLKPDLSVDTIIRRLSEPRAGHTLSSILRSRLHLSSSAAGLLRERLSAETLNDHSRLASAIKSLDVELLAPRPLDEAISSAGGIDMSEIDETLMLKKLPGVFVAGEMLGWEAPTGGYLLQGAFTTGYVAAKGILERVDGFSTGTLEPRPLIVAPQQYWDAL
ncbi:MAG: TIGR03862 family flavoprotein [Candidatus Riflebacteria bacterium]|nr:TIGR03862 family flavoprotein [Candidatus Riflebacteria bacterium]